jgi:hypothetical protein
VADWEVLRAYALALPGVREVDYRGEPWLQVGSKGFVLRSQGRVIMKLERHHQEFLFEVRPEVFTPMIAGRLRWSFAVIEELDDDEAVALVREAWTQVVPKTVSRKYLADAAHL